MSIASQFEELGCSTEQSYNNTTIVNGMFRIASTKKRWCIAGKENEWYDYTDIPAFVDTHVKGGRDSV